MTEESNSIASLKIQIDNDINNKSRNDFGADEIEEGETSFEDEVEVNVIVQDNPKTNSSFEEYISPLKNKKSKSAITTHETKNYLDNEDFQDEINFSKKSSRYGKIYDSFDLVSTFRLFLFIMYVLVFIGITFCSILFHLNILDLFNEELIGFIFFLLLKKNSSNEFNLLISLECICIA